jgi:hypothetical protein
MRQKMQSEQNDSRQFNAFLFSSKAVTVPLFSRNLEDEDT